MDRLFKIAVNGINGKDLFFIVTLLELQILQIKMINFRYVIGG